MERPNQFEVILDQYQNTKVEGSSLNGDIDFMFGRNINLLDGGQDLKTVFVVTPSITAVDTEGKTVEASAEIILNIYKYGYKFTDIDLYGLFCHAYIVFYHIITAEILKRNIFHNNKPYVPTKTIPSFEEVKDEITMALNKIYG